MALMLRTALSLYRGGSGMPAVCRRLIGRFARVESGSGSRSCWGREKSGPVRLSPLDLPTVTFITAGSADGDVYHLGVFSGVDDG